MLTRLQITNFKNLRDVDVRFGPFTCIAGGNGVGKSNLFDAIEFLSNLAERTLVESAVSVRSADGRSTDIGSLFFRSGDTSEDEMRFVADLIVPKEGVDDLGQEARAAATYLRYTLAIRLRSTSNGLGYGDLEIIEESLLPLAMRSGPDAPAFPHTDSWLTSVRTGGRGREREAPFISTTHESPVPVIRQFQEGRQGRPLDRRADGLKRTVLSSVTAEYPTPYLARREILSWRLLQLEPSALRESDPFTAPTQLEANGAHLASSLYQLARGPSAGDPSNSDVGSTVYARITNRLAELIEGVTAVDVVRDDQRQSLTVQVRDQTGTYHPARSLSDGTLRFLALSVLDLEATGHGVICMEEPENGIHPVRIPAMLSLLQDIAVATDYPVDESNPLRQVLINTHSPAVVGQVLDDSLLLADTTVDRTGDTPGRGVRFRGLAQTWRARSDEDVIPRNQLLGYLNPIDPEPIDIGDESPASDDEARRPPARRVIDREDIRELGLPIIVAPK